MIKKKLRIKYNYFINKKYAKTNMVYSLFGCLSKISAEDTVILYGIFIIPKKLLIKF